MAKFNLLASNITNLELKLEGKLLVNRDELLALVNSFGRIQGFYTKDKDNNEIEIETCEAKEKYDLSNLDVSEISNFNDMFAYSNFEGDISKWNTFSATSMYSMFYKTNYFNCNINSWDVSKVTSMVHMFHYAKEFNSPLNNWNTSNITSMFYMFYGAEKFNQDIGMWNISEVVSLNSMFYETKEFNQNLNSWNISKVSNMDFIFNHTNSFNQPILWDLSKVKSCIGIFWDAKAFKKRFNNEKELPYDIKLWLKENRNKMIALDVENNKSNDLDNFLLNLNVIDSANLNGLHNDNKELCNGNI